MRGYVYFIPGGAAEHRAVEVSHPALLPVTDDGGEWVEVPSLPANQWMAVQGSEGPEIVPFVRDPAIDLCLCKMAKWEAAKAKRAERLLVASTSYGDFDIDPVGKGNINGQIAALDVMVQLGVPEPKIIPWKLHTNDFVYLTPTQLREVGVLVAQYMGLVYAASWQLETAINNAEDINAVEEIDIESGWPT